MLLFNLLKFDTELFGFGVAKILAPKLDVSELQTILKELQQQDVHLVYWPVSQDKLSQQVAQQFKGMLCSNQITYLLNLQTLTVPAIAPEVVIYQEPTATVELEQLAMQAGMYSRFKVDPKFPHELFVKLYRAWIANSVNGTIAKRVMVIRYNNKVVGMITLGTKNSRGDIGLLAVSSEFRNQHFGTKLVHAAQAYFLQNGYKSAQVVTQQANVLACHLYEKCGFRREKTELFYHFWL